MRRLRIALKPEFIPTVINYLKEIKIEHLINGHIVEIDVNDIIINMNTLEGRQDDIVFIINKYTYEDIMYLEEQ